MATEMYGAQEVPWFLSPFPASYQLFGRYFCRRFCQVFGQLFLSSFCWILCQEFCRVFDRLLFRSKPKWLPLSFLLYLLSKRGQVRLYDFHTSPFIASLVHVVSQSKYNKNDKGSQFGLDPNNSRSKTRHKSQQKDLRKKVGQKVDMRPEKGRETMALTGLRRNGITRKAY